MSITYEEALSTLESMFGAPWDREHLDLILRHFQGHMENTVEAILAHGDQAPSLLVTNLKSGKANEARDSELARQLAAQDRQRDEQQQQLQRQLQQRSGRGLPTELPPDFLRVPGYQPSSASPSSVMDQDEALARMLQDELFSHELANNPEFAHLANARRQQSGIPRGSTMSRPAAPRTNANQPPPIIEHISELGQDAKKRLQLLAAQWNTGVNNLATRLAGNSTTTSRAGVSENTAAANETRGLLDDNDDNGEEMEMSFAATNK